MIRDTLTLLISFCHLVATYFDTRSAFSNGDFVIGVLLPVHYEPQNANASHSLKCGKIWESYGIQRAEAAFRTVDKINADKNLLGNLTLGIEIRDECWYAPIALRQSIEFIRDAITLSAPTDYDKCVPSGRRRFTKRGSLIGVVGPGASSVAVQVQNLLQLFEIPQIGYSSTSADLTDATRYNFFLRVVPTDLLQAQAMLDVVSRLGWKYVSTVNTGGNYGQSGIKAFQDLAEKSDVCVAQQEHVLSTDSDQVFDNVILRLLKQPLAKVVVCFCEGRTVMNLFKAIKRLKANNPNMTGNPLLFVGSDGWADRQDVIDGLQSEAWGGISLRIRSPYVPDFDDYFKALTPKNNSRNPWFVEYWETRFNCTVNSTTNPCPEEGNYGDSYKQDAKLSFVVKAIYTLAIGLHNMQIDLCGDSSHGICHKLAHHRGSLFKKYLMNVSFQYEGDVVEFNQKGGPPGRYDILNYQRRANGTYFYAQVGEWNNGTLNLNETILQFGPNTTIESVCSKPCPKGQKKDEKQQGNDRRCCWTCHRCNPGDILIEEGENQTCIPCDPGYNTDELQMACIKLPIKFVQWTDKDAIISMCFAFLGFLATLFALLVFMKHGQTPVVKSSTKELSYIILIGALLAHASILAILSKPNEISCGVTRCLPGISFAMIYAALLTKTNRIARILAGSKKKFPTRKPRFMSTSAQVVITCFLVLIEASISVGMVFYEPPASKNVYLEDYTRLECNTTREGVLAPLVFDFCLMLLCTLYAVKTRNVPENFNEAKFIGFSMYTNCVIWIAFIPIYFGSDLKVTTMCMCVTLSATVVWVFLFAPKLYIILLRPEKNNRTLFTTCKSIRCHIGSKVSSAMPESSISWRDSSTSTVREPTKKRTLSCQTGDELLEVLLRPRLYEIRNTPLLVQVPRITEKKCCEINDCQVKEITIKLPVQNKDT